MVNWPEPSSAKHRAHLTGEISALYLKIGNIMNINNKNHNNNNYMITLIIIITLSKMMMVNLNEMRGKNR